MLNGEEILGCDTCKNMEEQGKVSGRQKQLLKDIRWFNEIITE